MLPKRSGAWKQNFFRCSRQDAVLSPDKGLRRRRFRAFSKKLSPFGWGRKTADLLGFGFVFAQPQALLACSFAQASPKHQNLSLPNGYSIFSNALVEVMNLFDSFFSQVLTLVPFVSLYYRLALSWSLPCRSSFDRMSKSGGQFSIDMESLKFATTLISRMLSVEAGAKIGEAIDGKTRHVWKFKMSVRFNCSILLRFKNLNSHLCRRRKFRFAILAFFTVHQP
jgi:hypothetical protein